jgi:pimeloyl-ACP methyl ester carboxylesterase
MQQPIHEYGGSGPVMHMALANGFPPQTYTPLLAPFTRRYRVTCLPPRALWPGIGLPPDTPGSWRDLADDLLAGMRHYDLSGVTAVGHSFGAIATLLAALADPGRFRALVLLDPTLLPPDTMAMLAAAHAQGLMPRFPLVEQARVRRHRFESAQAAFDYWRAKPLFQDWTDEALWLYTHSMTRPADDGDGLALTWPREWEAHYFMSVYTAIWDDLPRLNGLLPVLVIGGETTDTFVAESVAKARELLPAATFASVPGGHLFPHTAPVATRSLMEGWLVGL